MTTDPVLLIITLMAVAIAATTSVGLVRLTREERRRSEARVALLNELAAEDGELALRTAEAPDTAEPAMFHADAERTPWLRRALVISGLAMALITGGWMFTSFGGSAQKAPAQSAASVLPLELLSLRHALQDDVFTVTGLVQNPNGGRQLARVDATVLVFDSAGTMLTSGRAPLDFTQLGAGDESPFVIRVPVAGTVARYRVGFRGPDGNVLGHVDRRNLESAVRREAP
jgi:hypothetical protein